MISMYLVHQSVRHCRSCGFRCRVIVDAAQAVAHVPIDVLELGVTHWSLVVKLYGPLERALWIKKIGSENSNRHGGGGMTDSVYYVDYHADGSEV